MALVVRSLDKMEKLEVWYQGVEPMKACLLRVMVVDNGWVEEANQGVGPMKACLLCVMVVDNGWVEKANQGVGPMKACLLLAMNQRGLGCLLLGPMLCQRQWKMKVEVVVAWLEVVGMEGEVELGLAIWVLRDEQPFQLAIELWAVG